MKITEMPEASAHDLDRSVQGLNTKVFGHGGKLYGQVDTGREEQRSHHKVLLPPGQRIPLFPATRARLGLI